MQDAEREAYRLSKITSAIKGDADPEAIYDTCRGCGKCMHLNNNGMCDTDECKDALFKRAQEAGSVHTWGDTSFFVADDVATMKTPPPTKETQAILRKCGDLQDALPTCRECDSIPRPDDTLCIKHRLEENARIHVKEKRVQHVQTNVGGADELPSNRKRRHEYRLRGKIRGFEKAKAKG